LKETLEEDTYGRKHMSEILSYGMSGGSRNARNAVFVGKRSAHGTIKALP